MSFIKKGMIFCLIVLMYGGAFANGTEDDINSFIGQTEKLLERRPQDIFQQIVKYQEKGVELGKAYLEGEWKKLSADEKKRKEKGYSDFKKMWKNFETFAKKIEIINKKIDEIKKHVKELRKKIEKKQEIDEKAWYEDVGKDNRVISVLLSDLNEDFKFFSDSLGSGFNGTILLDWQKILIDGYIKEAKLFQKTLNNLNLRRKEVALSLFDKWRKRLTKTLSEVELGEKFERVDGSYIMLRDAFQKRMGKRLSLFKKLKKTQLKRLAKKIEKVRFKIKDGLNLNENSYWGSELSQSERRSLSVLLSKMERFVRSFRKKYNRLYGKEYGYVLPPTPKKLEPRVFPTIPLPIPPKKKKGAPPRPSKENRPSVERLRS